MELVVNFVGVMGATRLKSDVITPESELLPIVPSRSLAMQVMTDSP